MRQVAYAVGLAAAVAFAGGASAKTLNWASQGDALTMDPHAQNEGPTGTMSAQVYDTLILRDSKLAKIPGLAVSWKPVEAAVWEFKLRENVKFHEGQAFNADDVVFSFQRALSETSDFKNYVNSIETVDKVDDFTVRITTKGPNPILPDQISSIRIMDKEWSEQHGVQVPQNYKEKEETYAVRNANGTGPFVLTKRDPDIETRMKLNESWWGWGVSDPKTNVTEVIYRPIANPATRVAALLSGELDFVLDPPLQDLARIKATPGLKVEEINQIRTIFYGLDTGAEKLRHTEVEGGNPFRNPKVREAMYRAIDIDTIRKKTMRGLSFPAGIITSPGVHGYTEALDQRLGYDPDAARKLLADAGYPNGFKVQLDCPNDRYNNDEAICQATVGMLARIGIEVSLNARSKSIHFKSLQNKESDFYMLGWGVPTLDSHYVFSYLAASKGSWNFTGLSDARLDELTTQMETETDAAKRDAMIQEAWEILKTSNAYLPLHHQVIAWGLKDGLTLPIVPNDSPQFRTAQWK
ncbi:MAG: ABC transporter substrate-binding protein [Thalassobaculum sp.]|uniref:ABC transporter substrate-binding protein n=1 Tax=Thalassobaculum sp. TaxID=2022740 RepID=UPI0032EDF1A8